MPGWHMDVAREHFFTLIAGVRHFPRNPSDSRVPIQERHTCRINLASVLEDWILIKVRHGDEMPVIGGHDLNPMPAYAEAC